MLTILLNLITIYPCEQWVEYDPDGPHIESSPTQDDINGFLDAAERGDLKAVKEHISEYGVNINITRKSTEKTALMLAIYFGHIDTIKYLIENGASLKNEDYYMVTTLDYLAYFAEETPEKYNQLLKSLSDQKRAYLLKLIEEFEAKKKKARQSSTGPLH